MPYLLSLDLGTSSIGYCLFDLDAQEQIQQLHDCGVRIFNDGRDPKTKESLAVARRMARGTRRNRDRGQNRVRRLVKELIEFGLLPKEAETRKQVFNQLCPYHCRNAAVTQTINNHELGRALFHLGRRRGFKSNRLSAASEESDYKQKIVRLREQLGEQTLGQYLFRKIQANHQLKQQGKQRLQRSVRFRGEDTEFYADRQMYRDEFSQIREKQKTMLSDAQWDALAETIFWQYPLKPVERGKCRFFPEHPRAFSALPIAHDFRIYQEVNNLRYRLGAEEFDLEPRQQQIIYQQLQTHKSKTFNAIAKLKDEHGSPLFPTGITFNLDTPLRNKKLTGNVTRCTLRQDQLLGELTDSMTDDRLNDLVEFLCQPIKTINHKKVIMEDDEIITWLKQHYPELDDEQIKNLCKTKFPSGTMGVSRKFIERIVPILRDRGLIYSEAIKLVADDDGESLHHSQFETKKYDRLPYYGEAMPESVWGEQPENDQDKLESERDNDAYRWGKIANPTVHVALNQLRKVVNQIIDQNQGELPSKIHVELSRDLKNSKESKDKINKTIQQNLKNRQRIAKWLKEEFQIEHPSREDFQKVILWEELGKKGARLCVFTGKPISCRQLFSGEVEIEHIVPFSKCFDDGMVNKTLAFKFINQVKGNNTPAEAFHGDEYLAILKRAEMTFGNSPKFKRFQENALEVFYGDNRDFLNRQLNDTRYISRKTHQYLQCICEKNDIVPVNGQITALLRHVWDLNRYKDKANDDYRQDHRHHIVDAFVAGLTSRSLLQLLAARSAKDNQHPLLDKNLKSLITARAPKIDHLKQQLYNHLESVQPSHKQDHSNQGSLFNETAYGSLFADEAGNRFGVTRKKVVDLSYPEIFQIRSQFYRSELLKFLTAGKNIDSNILGPRESVKQLKQIVGKETQLKEQLLAFCQQQGIKKLRLNVPNNSIKAIASAPYKGYALNSYAYCDVWQIAVKQDPESGFITYRYEGIFIPYADVLQYQDSPKRPVSKDGRIIPTAKKLMRLYKQDCLKMTDHKSGQINHWRVAGYNVSQNKIDIRSTLAAGDDNRNFKSINTLFTAHQVKKLR